MVIDLEGTNSSKISAALLQARRSAGSPAMGMVLTLIIVCDEHGYETALKASTDASREHPSRILLVVTASGREASLDAQVRIGEGTPGEVVVIRMRGAIAQHPASVIRPLLLPDSPVVIWWPGKGPTNPANDQLAQLAVRRITDAMGTPRPMAALRARAENYTPGDTDLSWTRLTPWRALLAASLDQYPAKVKGVRVEAERGNASAELLAAWLESRLKVPVERGNTGGPGITAVRMTTAAGDIAITRPDGLLASYTVPGQPNRLVALKRRDVSALVTEELRRMDDDDVFEQTVKALQNRTATPAKKAARTPRSTSAKAAQTRATTVAPVPSERNAPEAPSERNPLEVPSNDETASKRAVSSKRAASSKQAAPSKRAASSKAAAAPPAKEAVKRTPGKRVAGKRAAAKRTSKASS
jgi:glucose-6-phosphate dehydrogenase assembly protein OpcA